MEQEEVNIPLRRGQGEVNPFRGGKRSLISPFRGGRRSLISPFGGGRGR